MTTTKKGNDEKIEVANVNVPGHVTRVNAAMYHAMRDALLIVLPEQPPGMTQNEMREAVKAHLPDTLYPDGAKAGWWSKTVQLDLEAKGVVSRAPTKPLRWFVGKPDQPNSRSEAISKLTSKSSD